MLFGFNFFLKKKVIIKEFINTFPMAVDYVNLFLFSFYSISLNLQLIVISLDENLILLFAYDKRSFQFRKKIGYIEIVNSI